MARSSQGKIDEKTIAIVDVENASVGAALVHLSSAAVPKLFIQKRIILPIPKTFNEDLLHEDIVRATEELLVHTSEAAARMRHQPSISSLGEIEHIVIFLRPPWATMEFSPQGFQPSARSSLLERIRAQSRALFDTVPVYSHAFATAVPQVMQDFFSGTVILSVLTGEITELIALTDGALQSYSAFPFGMHTPVRTLQTHAGLTPEEAHSALKLSPDHLGEPIESAHEYFADLFYYAVKDMAQQFSPERILILAPEPHGDMFAHSLSQNPLAASLFKDETAVHALRSSHLSSLIQAPGASPDLFLMLEGLFVHKRYGV